MSAQSESLQRRLRRAVLLPIVGAAIVGPIFLATIQRLLSESASLRDSAEVIATAEQIRELAVDMETGVRGYLLTHDPRFLAPHDHASTTLPALLRRLGNFVGDNAAQKRRVTTMTEDLAAWQRFATDNMRSAAPERRLIAGKLLMDRFRSDHDQFLQAERLLSMQRTKDMRQATIGAIAVTVVLAIVAAAILTMFIRRQLQAISTEYEGALAAAEQSDLAKDRMLATVSHELRTPLTSILGWSALIRSGAADEETRQLAMASIEQSARLQTRLVEDLIDVSRTSAGKLRIDPSEIDLREVVEATLETMRPAADAKSILLATSGNDGNLRMQGDAARLQQVFWNLLSNAVRFTPPGGRIDLSVSREDGFVLIRVVDTGVGIEREFLPHVFEPFAQQNESGKRTTGLGLGLAIARRLIELHGGTISVTSEGAGRGAVFSVRLPLPPAVPDAAGGSLSPRA